MRQVQSGRPNGVKLDGLAKVDGLEPNWKVICGPFHQFQFFGPSTFIPEDRPVSSF